MLTFAMRRDLSTVAAAVRVLCGFAALHDLPCRAVWARSLTAHLCGFRRCLALDTHLVTVLLPARVVAVSFPEAGSWDLLLDFLCASESCCNQTGRVRPVIVFCVVGQPPERPRIVLATGPLSVSTRVATNHVYACVTIRHRSVPARLTGLAAVSVCTLVL